MSMTNEQFLSIVTEIKEFWPKDDKLNSLSPVAWMAYKNDLDEYTHKQVLKGLSGYRKSKFCRERPLAGNIIDHISKPNAEISAKDSALLAWETVNSDIRSGSNTEPPTTKDQIALKVIESMGGFYELSQGEESKMNWTQKEFIKTYEIYVASPAILALLNLEPPNHQAISAQESSVLSLVIK